MTPGHEWVVDAYGCGAEPLRDAVRVQALLEQIVQHLDLHIAQPPVIYPFPHAGGITAMYLLMESHLTCHTYPEMGFAAFNLYCCRPRTAYPWEESLRQALGAQRVVLHGLSRGGR